MKRNAMARITNYSKPKEYIITASVPGSFTTVCSIVPGNELEKEINNYLENGVLGKEIDEIKVKFYKQRKV